MIFLNLSLICLAAQNEFQLTELLVGQDEIWLYPQRGLQYFFKGQF